MGGLENGGSEVQWAGGGGGEDRPGIGANRRWWAIPRGAHADPADGGERDPRGGRSGGPPGTAVPAVFGVGWGWLE